MKKKFTLIELIIVILVIGLLATMALPKVTGVVKNAKIVAMINDKEVLEKTISLYYQKYDELPLLNEEQELIVLNSKISLTKLVQAEEATSNDMKTIYTSLQETLEYYNDSEENLYRIDLSKTKDYLSKSLKYGTKKTEKDFYVYSTKTNNVYYYNTMINGDGEIQHSEFNTALKTSQLVNKKFSKDFKVDDNSIIIEKNSFTIGRTHSMKISEDGFLYSWGRNTTGQLGLGNLTNYLTPQKVSIPNDEIPVFIKSRREVSMVITSVGNLYSCGYNSTGVLGTNNSSRYSFQIVNFPNNEKPIYVDTSGEHSMAISNKENLYVWGYNMSGQLGLGNDHTQKPTPQLLTLPNNEKPNLIATGGYHSMVITKKGNLYVWGKNDYGQLGTGNTSNLSNPKLLTLPNEEKAVSMALGKEYSLILTDQGNIYAFGRNDSGELGIGNTQYQTIPKLVILPKDVKPISIYAGYSHSMFLSQDGNIYSWGNNSSGQLGIGNNVNQTTPKIINTTNLIKFKDIFLGSYSSMSLSNDGNYYSWGSNEFGEIGNNDTINQKTPRKIELTQ